MDPDWRCKTQIENGDIPASYVHLPECITYNTSFNSCNKKTAVVKKNNQKRPNPPASCTSDHQEDEENHAGNGEEVHLQAAPTLIDGWKGMGPSILFVFGLLNTWHFFWAPKKLNVLFLEFRKEWDIVYIYIYTRYMYIHIYFQDFFLGGGQ